MERVIGDNDLQAEVGRASGGRTFVRVVHLPTGMSRQVVGLGDRSTSAVIADLGAAVVGELVSRGRCRPGERGSAEPDIAADSGEGM